MITGSQGSIGARWAPNSPASQPRSKIACTNPSDAAIVSRFMSAAWIGITSERNTSNNSSAETPITTAMNTGNRLEMTCAWSTCVAVNPPTYTFAPLARSIGAITWSRSRVTRL